MPADIVDNKVREIIADQLGISEDEIQAMSCLTSDLGADTLDIMELVLAFEEEFGRDIDDEDAREFKTVADIVNFLSRKNQ